MSYRTAIFAYAPSWLSHGNAAALLRTIGQMIDNLDARLKAGIKARFPEHAPEDALGLIGKDRSIERGPDEPADAYRARLIGAVDANRQRGSAGQLLRQLAGYFSGTGTPPIRLVGANGRVWHEYNWATGEVEKTKPAPQNWDWDGDASRWWRGWVIIDGSDLGVGPALELGSGAKVGDEGALLGCTGLAENQVQAMQRLVRRWKPENVHAVRLIITFVNNLFLADASPGDNPNGEYGDPADRDEDAVYFLSGGKEPTE